MPKENTHLYFAYKMLEEFQGQDIYNKITDHISQYLLGSIIADTFYYGHHASYRCISDYLHGKEGNPTNATIIQVLDSSHEQKDLAFVLGFISHCALDISFHPIIYYLAGNFYDEEPDKRSHAVYRHRHLETCLDIDIKNNMRLHRLIKTEFLKGLVFESIISDKFRVPPEALRNSLRRQIFYNAIFTSSSAYYLGRAALRLGFIPDNSQLGLFYADAAHGERMPSVIEAADLIDGTPLTTTVEKLFSDARLLAKAMMDAAYGYWKKSLGRDELLLAIPGLSLDTGKLGISASGIRYTRWECPTCNKH